VLPDVDWLARSGFTTLPDVDSHMLFGNLTVPNLAYGSPDLLGGQ
jgi:hypothetical protein